MSTTTFEQNVSQNGEYLWSNPGNWTNGLPTTGGNVIVSSPDYQGFEFSYDDLANLSLNTLYMYPGAIVMVSGSLSVGTVTTGTYEPTNNDYYEPELLSSGSASNVSIAVASGSYGFGIGAQQGGTTTVTSEQNSYGYVSGSGGVVVIEPQPQAYDDFVFNPSGGTFAFEDLTENTTFNGLYFVGSANGDSIALPGQTIVNVQITSSSISIQTNSETLTFDGVQYLGAGAPSGYIAQYNSQLGLIEVEFVSCFLTGTAIATPSGETAVGALRVGDDLLTADGRTVPLRWIGRRRVDAATPLDRELHYPVRVCRDAIAPGVPGRDLLVTGDHALFVDGLLIPARLLVNGVSIRAEREMTEFTYFHLELDRHDLLLAEGLPAESFLDTGNRHVFAPDTIAPAALREDAQAAYAARGVAPLALAAALVEPVWRRLAARAGAAAPRGVAAPGEAHLLAGGERLRPLYAGDGRLLFALPAGTDEIVIASDTIRPSDARPWLDDRRRLGVQVRRMRLLADGARDIALDGPQLSAGWHAVERDGDGLARWTAGVGRVRLAAAAAPGMIELTLGG